MSERLALGKAFPAVTVSLSDGSSMSLPDDMGEAWKAIVFYRGSW
jgi:hypothetical protein